MPPAHSTGWPNDPEHIEAIDALLAMAEAEDRWGESRRAARLLIGVERIVGRLSVRHERMLQRCLQAAVRP